MLEVSAFLLNTRAQASTPLVHCPVNDLLIELLPFFNETRPEMIDVTNTGAVYSLLQDTPYVIVDWIQIRTVRWP